MWKAITLGLVVVAACHVAGGTSNHGTTGPCTKDSDCASPTICQVCNGKCVYAPDTTCDLEFACPCGYSCRAGSCQSDLGQPQPACVYDRDCPVDQYCSRATYACEYPMTIGQASGVTCTANAQCADGEICSSWNGSPDQCVQNTTHQCLNDSECDATESCNPQGQCQHHSC